MSRTELFLIVGILSATAVLGAIRMAPAPAARDQGESLSWSQEEQAAAERLKRVSSQDPQVLLERLEGDPSLKRGILFFSLGLILLVAAAVMVLLRLGSRFLARAPLYKSLGVPPDPAWGLREILRVTAALFLLTEAALLGQWWIRHSLAPPWLDPHVLSLANTLLIDLAAVAAALALLGSARSRIFHWPEAGPWACLRFGMAGYLAFLPLFVFLALTAAWTAELLGRSPTPQAVFTIYLSESRTSVLAWLVALVTVAGPAAEEIFFRGLVYGWLRSRLSIGRALLLTAVLFGALHADPVAFLPITGLGLLFGWLYEKTGSLMAPLAVHILHNAGMLYFASLVKALAAKG
ncbi:MAG: CPBP family intramembrane metalloprotease [Candidatus Omnitrophica bacterium]|nr:CPBP family intramembrane metalloprotease [Candidatus Omnitrophota bacterium]